MLKIANHPAFVLPLPERHRFPMEKYDLLPQQLLYEGSIEAVNFFKPELPDDQHILAVHNKTYLDSLYQLKLERKKENKIGFPVSKALVKRELLIADGTIKGAEYALEFGIGMSIAGGTHHAYPGHGEGFCMLNDQAIAARYLQTNNLANKILIIDLDVHQGNGTAKIFSRDPSVFTFSMHGAKNYPFKKEQSDLDIELADKTEDSAYLKKLKSILPSLIERENPDFIFYQSGVDILETDKLGRLSCSIEGSKQRDLFVFETCKAYGIPVQCSIGGGYSKEIKHIVEAHANTFRTAIAVID